MVEPVLADGHVALTVHGPRRRLGLGLARVLNERYVPAPMDIVFYATMFAYPGIPLSGARTMCLQRCDEVKEAVSRERCQAWREK